MQILQWALDKEDLSVTTQEENNSGNNQKEQSEGNTDNTRSNPKGSNSTKKKYNKEHTVIPYMQGLEESIKNICKRYGMQSYFKGTKTIRNILLKTKDRDSLDRKSGAIYWYQCG